MKVFLLGGTGAIGRYGLAELVAAGHEVTALPRRPEKVGDGARNLTPSLGRLRC